MRSQRKGVGAHRRRVAGGLRCYTTRVPRRPYIAQTASQERKYTLEEP